MSQDNIFEFLKHNNDEWFTTLDLSKKIGINRGNIARNLMKLHNRGDVNKRVKFGTRTIWWKVK